MASIIQDKSLRHKTGEEWAADVARIDNDILRACVASIVWWDYFAGFWSASYNEHHLDKHVAAYDYKAAPTSAALAEGLVEVGYSLTSALHRVRRTAVGE